LKEEIQRISQRYKTLKYFSIVGHSLGGLYARYGIGELYKEKYFDQIIPLNFITLATPHVGSSSSEDFLGQFTNILCKYFLSSTGEQLILEDDKTNPLLLTMTLPDEPCFKALELFKDRSVYANVSGDLSVRYHTSALMETQSGALVPSTIDKYPSIIESVQVTPDSTKNKDEAEDTDEALSNSEYNSSGQTIQKKSEGSFSDLPIATGKSRHITQMLKNLRLLSWRRTSVLIDSWFFGHVKIISKPSWFILGQNADDVTEHVADNLLLCA